MSNYAEVSLIKNHKNDKISDSSMIEMRIDIGEQMEALTLWSRGMEDAIARSNTILRAFNRK